MATTFQNFQNEMDQIRTREAAKQRTQAPLPPETKSSIKAKIKSDHPAEKDGASVEQIDSGGDMLQTEEDIMVRHKLSFHFQDTSVFKLPFADLATIQGSRRS